MNIRTVETFVLKTHPEETYWGARAWGNDETDPAPYPPTFRRRYVYSSTIDTVLVRVCTDDGHEGWGEAKAPVGAGATAALIDELLAPIAIGSRPDEISRIWDSMYTAMRVRGHDSGFWLEALSGVDIALWDAWAHICGQPLSSLLGGRCRPTIPLYASGIPGARPGSGPDGQEAIRAEAQSLKRRGFDAVKVAIGNDPQTDISSIETVREAFPDGTVFADAAGQYDFAQAVHVGNALDDLGVGFFEMPLPPEDIDGYARLARKVDIPLALDSLTTRHRALQFLRIGALHVLQPDVCRAGGITETMRIATLADAFGTQATPHVSIGSPIHLAASLQCAAAIPNLPRMEFWIGDNPLNRVATEQLTEHDGLLDVPTSPGTGITIDANWVRQAASPSNRTLN